MTRRKWNKLRRQYPHLFKVLPPFEKWNDFEREWMRKVSKREALAIMTGWRLGYPDESPPTGAIYDRFRLTNLTMRS